MNQKWTWPEIIVTIVLLPVMFFGAMMLLGLIVDKAAQHSESHDRCLRAATNGYEIKQCR